MISGEMKGADCGDGRVNRCITWSHPYSRTSDDLMFGNRSLKETRQSSKLFHGVYTPENRKEINKMKYCLQ